MKMPKSLKLIIALNIALIFMWLYLMFCTAVEADPPHPRQHYKWVSLTNGNVVLFFLEDGQYMRYVYRLVHEPEPATACAPHYGEDTFRLVTWDMTYPYYYEMYYEPVLRWDNTLREYVTIR